MKVSISTSGPFHLFETAGQLQDRGYLGQIFTAYPHFKLRQWRVERRRIRSFPYFYAPWMMMNRANWRSRRIEEACDRLLRVSHDAFCRSELAPCDVFIGLSSFSLWSGRAARQRYGAIYVCERGSTHVAHQERVLAQEYDALGLPHRAQSPFVIEREKEEYEAADFISTPSRVVCESFVANGVSTDKLILQPYGVNTRFFKPKGRKSERFKVIFVGSLSIRKGLHRLLRAANRLKATDIVFSIVGSPSPDAQFLKSLASNPNIEWVGHLPWNRLADELSSAHVMVLPSIEEGLAIVQGQALACGCPVIASSATGAADLFVDGEQGIILDECTPETIEAAIMRLYSDPALRHQMSLAAASLADTLGGWADYGEKLSNRLLRLAKGGSRR